jgi:hypothetical protein
MDQGNPESANLVNEKKSKGQPIEKSACPFLPIRNGRTLEFSQWEMLLSPCRTVRAGRLKRRAGGKPLRARRGTEIAPTGRRNS